MAGVLLQKDSSPQFRTAGRDQSTTEATCIE
ncbi:hypothetical protein TNCV_127501, partial [Trichonephila clavipes]